MQSSEQPSYKSAYTCLPQTSGHNSCTQSQDTGGGGHRDSATFSSKCSTFHIPVRQKCFGNKVEMPVYSTPCAAILSVLEGLDFEPQNCPQKVISKQSVHYYTKRNLRTIGTGGVWCIVSWMKAVWVCFYGPVAELVTEQNWQIEIPKHLLYFPCMKSIFVWAR